MGFRRIGVEGVDGAAEVFTDFQFCEELVKYRRFETYTRIVVGSGRTRTYAICSLRIDGTQVDGVD